PLRRSRPRPGRTARGRDRDGLRERARGGRRRPVPDWPLGLVAPALSSASMDHVPPILEFDPDVRAVIEPHMIRSRLDVPAGAVLCFFSDVLDKVCVEGGAPVLTRLQSAHAVHPVYRVEWEGRPVAVFHPGVGAPIASMFLEEIIQTGCRNFVAVGGGGGLVPELTVGHVVVPTSAVRDEGTSY